MQQRQALKAGGKIIHKVFLSLGIDGRLLKQGQIEEHSCGHQQHRPHYKPAGNQQQRVESHRCARPSWLPAVPVLMRSSAAPPPSCCCCHFAMCCPMLSASCSAVKFLPAGINNVWSSCADQQWWARQRHIKMPSHQCNWRQRRQRQHTCQQQHKHPRCAQQQSPCANPGETHRKMSQTLQQDRSGT